MQLPAGMNLPCRVHSRVTCDNCAVTRIVEYDYKRDHTYGKPLAAYAIFCESGVNYAGMCRSRGGAERIVTLCAAILFGTFCGLWQPAV